MGRFRGSKSERKKKSTKKPKNADFVKERRKLGKKLKPSNATAIEFRTHGIRIAKQTMNPIQTLAEDRDNNNKHHSLLLNKQEIDIIDNYNETISNKKNEEESEEYNESDYDSGAGGNDDDIDFDKIENDNNNSNDNKNENNNENTNENNKKKGRSSGKQSKKSKNKKRIILNMSTINSDILTILSHLSNHKWKARRDILIYLKDVLNKILTHSRLVFIRVLHNNLVNIISIFELIYDPNSIVRQQLRNFINWFVSQCKDRSKNNKSLSSTTTTTTQQNVNILGKMRYSSLHNNNNNDDYSHSDSSKSNYNNRVIIGLFAPFWNIIMAHICAGLSHISNNIRFNTIKIFRTLFVIGNICEYFDFELLINLLKHLSLLFDDIIKHGNIYSVENEITDPASLLKNSKNSKKNSSNKNSTKKSTKKGNNNSAQSNIVIINILAEIMANVVRAIEKHVSDTNERTANRIHGLLMPEESKILINVNETEAELRSKSNQFDNNTDYQNSSNVNSGIGSNNSKMDASYNRIISLLFSILQNSCYLCSQFLNENNNDNNNSNSNNNNNSGSNNTKNRVSYHGQNASKFALTNVSILMNLNYACNNTLHCIILRNRVTLSPIECEKLLHRSLVKHESVIIPYLTKNEKQLICKCLHSLFNCFPIDVSFESMILAQKNQYLQNDNNDNNNNNNNNDINVNSNMENENDIEIRTNKKMKNEDKFEIETDSENDDNENEMGTDFENSSENEIDINDIDIINGETMRIWRMNVRILNLCLLYLPLWTNDIVNNNIDKNNNSNNEINVFGIVFDWIKESLIVCRKFEKRTSLLNDCLNISKQMIDRCGKTQKIQLIQAIDQTIEATNTIKI